MEEKVLDLLAPTVVFMGPMATHNYPCTVCRKNHAVLFCNTGVMEPCWECQSKGWVVKRMSWFDRVAKWWRSL